MKYINITANYTLLSRKMGTRKIIERLKFSLMNYGINVFNNISYHHQDVNSLFIYFYELDL